MKSSAFQGAHLGQLHGQLGEKCCSGRVNILAAMRLRMAFQWPFPGAYCFQVGTRESCNLSCWCLCCSVTWFAACLCGPWGCALCDLSQSQPLPPQQAVKDVLRQAVFSCCHSGTASNVKWGKGRDVAVIFGK